MKKGDVNHGKYKEKKKNQSVQCTQGKTLKLKKKMKKKNKKLTSRCHSCKYF